MITSQKRGSVEMLAFFTDPSFVMKIIHTAMNFVQNTHEKKSYGLEYSEFY